MHEQIAALAVPRRKRLHECNVGWRYHRAPLAARRRGTDTPRLQSELAAGMQPIRRRRAVARQGIERYPLMIPNQIDRWYTRDRRSRRQQRQNTGALGSKIDVIAEMQQQRRTRRSSRDVVGNRGVQLSQFGEAAMNVADGVDSAAAWQ